MNIHMMGDSTMKQNNYYSYPQFGWGQGLQLFTKEDIIIYNYAENGRSTKSFIDEGRFDKLLEKLQPGDYVICDFGHNDEKEYDETRYTDPYGSYTNNLLYFANKVKEKGANIVYATSITRHSFIDGKCVNTHGDYPKAMLKMCKENNLPCVDLNTLTLNLYNKLGEEETKKFHMIFEPNTYDNYPEGKDDHSHLRIDGAFMVAKLFVEDVNKQNLPIKDLFVDLNATGMIDFKMLKD